jgi:hypothetical protein
MKNYRTICKEKIPATVESEICSDGSKTYSPNTISNTVGNTETKDARLNYIIFWTQDPFHFKFSFILILSSLTFSL